MLAYQTLVTWLYQHFCHVINIYCWHNWQKLWSHNLYFQISLFFAELANFAIITKIAIMLILHMNPLKLLILLAWFVSIKSWICFVFPISGTGIIRLIFDCYYYFLGILVLTQGLLMVLSSITMISGLFFKKEVFILCILTSTVFYQK